MAGANALREHPQRRPGSRAARLATVTEHIQLLDLLCSGFHIEDTAGITALDCCPAEQLVPDHLAKHHHANTTDQNGAKP